MYKMYSSQHTNYAICLYYIVNKTHFMYPYMLCYFSCTCSGKKKNSNILNSLNRIVTFNSCAHVQRRQKNFTFSKPVRVFFVKRCVLLFSFNVNNMCTFKILRLYKLEHFVSTSLMWGKITKQQTTKATTNI